MTMIAKMYLMGMAALGAMTSLVALAAAQPAAPKIVVPKCDKPPVIDGRIELGEWQRAAAVSGFTDLSTGQMDARQVVAYITYDDANLYMAFDLPIYPKGAKLVTDRTTRDTGGWSGDDVLELLLDPFHGKYKNEESYFQFMGNSANVVLFDQAETPGLGLYNRLEWNGRWDFKNTTSGDHWYSELSIPLKDLGIDQIKDGSKWLVNFSRTWGIKPGWTTLSPVAHVLNVSGGGAELVFQSDAPAARLLGVEPLLQGRFGASGELVNGGVAREVAIVGRVVGSDGREIAAKRLNFQAAPNQVVPFSFDEAANLADKNVFHLSIGSADGKTIWQEIAVPFLKTTAPPIFPEVVRKKFILDIRYLPSFQKLWIDKLDFGGLPDRSSVKAIRLSVLKDGKSLASQMVPFTGMSVENVAVPIPNIVTTEGDYRIKAELLDGDGGELVSEQKTFWWKPYPFATSPAPNPTGILPPFTPMRQDGHAISVIGRTYKLNDLGLFDQITAGQLEPTVGGAVESILDRPMTIHARQNGGQPAVVEPVGKLSTIHGDTMAVVTQAHGRLDQVALTITNKIEYDGLSWIEMKLDPARPTQLEGLYLDIPIRADQATLLHEVTDSIRRVFAGHTPAGKGTVWDSGKLLNTSGMIGNFKPMYWLGNEDRGLCWFGESDKGWSLDEKLPALQVIRDGDEVILRVHFVNKAFLLDKPRTIAFGIQATPVKPMPNGWRGWVGPYSKAEHKNLTYFNFSPVAGQIPTYAATANAPYPADYEKAKEAMDKLRDDGCIPFLYEVMLGMGVSYPEAEAYRGEWIRASYIGAGSYVNFRVETLRDFLKKCGLFTFYEDNCYLVPIKDPALGYGYVRDDGQYQGEFALFNTRNLLKGEAEVYQSLGMPNYVGVHKSTTMVPPMYAFATIAIDGEQRFMTTPETDYIDQFSLDYIRAHIMGRQFGFVPFFLSEIKLPKDQTKAIHAGTRSEFALLWLNEIASWPAYGIDQATVDNAIRAKGQFDIAAADVKFHPYWEKDKVVKTDSSDTVVSLWSRPGKALAVVANLGEARDCAVSIDFSRLGLNPKVIRDFESGESLSPGPDGSLKVPLPRHDYRLIWIE
ncbi:MAG: hypothetical protein IT446_09975 [Phycisphaerales bacterium]|nr:hypothetical protein [Phycisphaerales bacterium]